MFCVENRTGGRGGIVLRHEGAAAAAGADFFADPVFEDLRSGREI